MSVHVAERSAIAFPYAKLIDIRDTEAKSDHICSMHVLKCNK